MYQLNYETCDGTDSYQHFIGFSCPIEMPNAFTPNNDGHNDQFKVSVMGGDEYELIVFDRWGKEVFRTENPQEGWDGNYKNGNPAEQAVYTYRVIVHNGDTGQQIQRGKVTLAK